MKIKEIVAALKKRAKEKREYQVCVGADIFVMANSFREAEALGKKEFVRTVNSIDWDFHVEEL